MANKDMSDFYATFIMTYSKNPYIKTLNFEGQTVIGSYSMKTKYQAVRFLNRFLIHKTVNVHGNPHFVFKHVKF